MHNTGLDGYLLKVVLFLVEFTLERLSWEKEFPFDFLMGYSVNDCR